MKSFEERQDHKENYCIEKHNLYRKEEVAKVQKKVFEDPFRIV
jgi:hypothetical protein